MPSILCIAGIFFKTNKYYYSKIWCYKNRTVFGIKAALYIINLPTHTHNRKCRHLLGTRLTDMLLRNIVTLIEREVLLLPNTY